MAETIYGAHCNTILWLFVIIPLNILVCHKHHLSALRLRINKYLVSIVDHHHHHLIYSARYLVSVKSGLRRKQCDEKAFFSSKKNRQTNPRIFIPGICVRFYLIHLFFLPNAMISFHSSFLPSSFLIDLFSSFPRKVTHFEGGKNIIVDLTNISRNFNQKYPVKRPKNACKTPTSFACFIMQ